MIYYDGLEDSFGVHTLRVHLQSEEFKGYFDFEFDGKNKGLSTLDFDFSDWEDEDFKCLAEEKLMHNVEISVSMEEVVTAHFVSGCEAGYDEYVYKIKIFKEGDSDNYIYGEYTAEEANNLIIYTKRISWIS